MTRSCEYYESLIEQMADGSVTDEQACGLREHIRTCPKCRAMYVSFASLRGDTADIPTGFSAGVMGRIAAEGRILPDVALPEAGRASRASGKKKTSRLWPSLAAAACLALILMGGLTALKSRRFDKNGAAQYESAAMDAAAPMEGRSADTAPAAAPAGGAAMDAGEPEESLADEAAPEMALAGSAMEIPTAAGDTAPAYTRDAPAYVPAGQEDAFEALLSDARWEDGEPAEAWHVIAAVEYRGVIYEFLTDDGQNYLLWQDAAEGLPVHSPGTVAELWDILG